MILARPYRDQDASAWDALCAGALNATFLHSRSFLSYHGTRFADRSLLLEREGTLVGVVPAAVDPVDDGCVCSHPGSTYGGVVHEGALRGPAMIEALRAACIAWRDAGLRTLRYKAVPTIYHGSPAQDDSYALFRLGATRARCDLSSAIDLEGRLPVSERRRRSLKRAAAAGLTIDRGPEVAGELWGILQENLERRHGVAPVHTLEEILDLARRFPDAITFHLARDSAGALAGLVLFDSRKVAHAQYIASSERGQQCNALDLLFEDAISGAHRQGRRYFDFGISTESAGRVLNEGLHRFKSEFGASGAVHEFFELALADVY